MTYKRLTAEAIEANVKIIAHSYLKGVKTKVEDVPVIDAGIALITNFLVNVNDVAYEMVKLNDVE